MAAHPLQFNMVADATAAYVITLPIRARVVTKSEQHPTDAAPAVVEEPAPHVKTAVDEERTSAIEPVTLANKLCYHATAHYCRYLAASDTKYCTSCHYAVSNGLPCV